MKAVDEAELERLLEEAARHERPRLEGRTSFLIYGAGGRGREVRRVLAARGHEVIAFIDRAARSGSELDGLPVLAPDDPDALRINAAGARVVLGVYRDDIDVVALAATLSTRGYQDLMPFFDVYQLYPEDFSTTYWLGPVDAIIPHSRDVRNAFSRLDDATSREVFLGTLRMRVRGDVRALGPPDVSSIYAPRDVVTLREPVRLVDGGAYDGDTVRGLRAANVRLEAIAAFEPDLGNFAALVKFAKQDSCEEFFAFPCGLWSKTEVLAFEASASTGAHLSGAGSTAVPCVAVDDVIRGFRPTLFKLDVEGAEPEALEGARETIARHRPTLAISAYHVPDHLWSLQKQIAEWDLGYRFALRHHGYSGFSLVLYAVPT